MTTKLCSWDCEPSAEYTLFTCGNVNEVLPGVTRPLYADLATEWDWRWTEGVTQEMQVRDLITIKAPPHFNMLGFVGGRWALNVSFSLALTPLYEIGEGSAMLTSFFEGGDQIKSGAHEDRSRAAIAHDIIMGKWVDAEGLTIVADRLARDSWVAAKERRLDSLSDAQLVELVDENSVLMGKLFEPHFYVSVGGGDFQARLAAMLDQHVPDHPPEWATTLTSALLEVESARPGKAIWDLSRLVKGRPTLASEVAGASVEHVLARLAAPPTADWRALAGEYRLFMEEFGWRGQRESVPSTPTWDEAPNFVISAIQADLAAPESRNPHEREREAARARVELEKTVLARIPEAERPAFERHLVLTQSLSRAREGVKATWARAARNYRWPIQELGRRLARRGVLQRAEDIWFLRLEELHRAGEGGLGAEEARAVVAARRAEFERLQGFEAPEGVFTWPAELAPIGAKADLTQRQFKALAVSPGVATGRARVILSADAAEEARIEPGEILVAPITDAPWTPLFIPAAGVVVEVGGVLSHAATVAREFGIPGVSGVRDATRIIQTGQLITIDGNTGTVTIHSE
ncbi:MAG: hypothetical protein IT304_11705 [Dehalococcoidia bacterium]|nr:hypothetical protein [Dehalococcoidia bacterium]